MVSTSLTLLCPPYETARATIVVRLAMHRRVIGDAPDKRDGRPEYPDLARARLQHGLRRIKRIDINFDFGAVGIFSGEALHQAPRCRRDLAPEAGVLADIIVAVEAIRKGNLGLERKLAAFAGLRRRGHELFKARRLDGAGHDRPFPRQRSLTV